MVGKKARFPAEKTAKLPGATVVLSLGESS